MFKKPLRIQTFEVEKYFQSDKSYYLSRQKYLAQTKLTF